MLSSINMLATVPTWIRAVSYSHTHTNAPWIIDHIAKTPTNPRRYEHQCGQASCHSTGQYAHVAYGKPYQGAGHWCRVDMHSILPSHSPPRSMHIAHTAKNSPECWLFGYVYAQTSWHSTGQCVPIAPAELLYGARCWCGADVHTLPARARTFTYQAHHQKVKKSI